MRFDDPICPVCDRPALPDDAVVKAGHDITHLGCLPSGRTMSAELTRRTTIAETKT